MIILLKSGEGPT